MGIRFGAVLSRANITGGNLNRLKSLGFDGVELFIGEPSEGRIRSIVEIVKPLLDEGFKVSDVFASGIDLVRLALEGFDRAKPRCEMVFKAAELLETPIVLLPVFRTPSGVDRADVLTRAITVLRMLDSLASDRCVTLALEPLNRYETNVLKTMSETLSFIEKANCKSLKTMADVYHMSIEEAWIPDALRLISRYLVHIHASENHGGIPGTGTIPYPHVMRALREINYDGFISIELHRRVPDLMEAYRKALNYLKALSEVF